VEELFVIEDRVVEYYSSSYALIIVQCVKCDVDFDDMNTDTTPL
jgi:hypothetical protein